jgi:hypothetical protein
MSHPVSVESEAWAMIDKERRRDRFVRMVSIVAWAVTVGVVLIYGALTAVRVSRVAKLVAVGVMERMATFDAMMPFIAVVGILSLLIAVLATVGMFLRLRTASLAEIQLRLAALESLLASRSDTHTN